MYGAATAQSNSDPSTRCHPACSSSHMDSDSDSDCDEDVSGTLQNSTAQSKPWMLEFERYLRMSGDYVQIKEGTDLVQWWGVSLIYSNCTHIFDSNGRTGRLPYDCFDVV